MIAFFKKHPKLARTPAGQIALLRIEVRRLGAQVRSLQASRRISNHPLYDAFMCIHGYEDAGLGWRVNTGNGYYGGLQMDWDFMETYGSEFLAWYGTADKWPPADQIRVAIRAHESGRGFYPWPNTARYCGLL